MTYHGVGANKQAIVVVVPQASHKAHTGPIKVVVVIPAAAIKVAYIGVPLVPLRHNAPYNAAGRPYHVSEFRYPLTASPFVPRVAKTLRRHNNTFTIT